MTPPPDLNESLSPTMMHSCLALEMATLTRELSVMKPDSFRTPLRTVEMIITSASEPWQEST